MPFTVYAAANERSVTLVFLDFGGTRDDPCRPPEELRQNLGRSRNFPQLSAPTQCTGCCYYPPNKSNPIHRPLDFPHVADIASIREGPEQQVCRCCFWPSMASGSGSAACWARREGKSCLLSTRAATN